MARPAPLRWVDDEELDWDGLDLAEYTRHVTDSADLQESASLDFIAAPDGQGPGAPPPG